MTAAPRRAVPHRREFLADTLSPVAVYRRLAAPGARRFLFESVSGGEQVARFSLLGAAPGRVCRLFADRLEIEAGGERRVVRREPLAALRRELSAVVAEPAEIPFVGGWVGYFGFDLVRLLERLPEPPPDPFGMPIAELARYDRVVVFDHAHQRVVAVASEIEGESDRHAAEAALDELSDRLSAAGPAGAIRLAHDAGEGGAVEAECGMSGADFRRAVRRVQEHIAAGDVFQVVVARRWRLAAAADPLALYRGLRLVNPSPYMVLLEAPGWALVGASPEMLVRRQGERLETRPIAGTRPRGADAAEDRRLAAELLADAKERAEHVMLVDLGRNDLGRVSRPGTVEVARFMEVERYSHVMHLVSEVEGRLEEGRDGLDALLACFPAGTVSGAPKIRAMEILGQLEPEARGPYAGAVGYLSFTGDLDTCITIRTLVVRQNEVSVTAGAGVVADSDPRAEELETESKAAALVAAVARARHLGDGA